MQFIDIHHYLYQLKSCTTLNSIGNNTAKKKRKVNDGKNVRKILQTEFIMLHKQKHLDFVYNNTYY